VPCIELQLILHDGGAEPGESYPSWFTHDKAVLPSGLIILIVHAPVQLPVEWRSFGLSGRSLLQKLYTAVVEVVVMDAGDLRHKGFRPVTIQAPVVLFIPEVVISNGTRIEVRDLHIQQRLIQLAVKLIPVCGYFHAWG